MNAQQTKTLRRIFENPIRADVRWDDIESLFRSFGAEIIERRGSRICVILRDVVSIFHRPHPSVITDRGVLKSVRKFLMEAGVKP